jgi:hypothetical protein
MKIKRNAVGGQLRQKISKTSSQPIGGHGVSCQSSLAMREAEMGRDGVPAQPGEKKIVRSHLNV